MARGVRCRRSWWVEFAERPERLIAVLSGRGAREIGGVHPTYELLLPTPKDCCAFMQELSYLSIGIFSITEVAPDLAYVPQRSP